MSNISLEILLIASIFAAGITLYFTVGLIAGIGFIIAANIALPAIIKFNKPLKKLGT